MKGFIGFIVILTVFIIKIQRSSSVSADFDAEKSLKNLMKEDEFVIEMKDIKPKHRMQNSLERLFIVDFSKSDKKLAILLDRESNKVIVETAEDGITQSQNIELNDVEPKSTISSLLLAVNQNSAQPKLTLYHDCTKKKTVNLPYNFRKIVKGKNAHLQVFREKRFTLHLHHKNEVQKILEDNGCFDREMQDQQPNANDLAAYRRGDIPVFHDCDDRDSLLAKTINALIELVKMLKQDIEHQRGEIRYLRNLLERCDICARK